MLGRILLSALIAGVIAGLVVSVLQAWQVTPLIYQAETYEVVAEAPAHSHADEQAAGHTHDHAGAPSDGGFDWARIGMTALANVVTGIGFALLLGAGFALFGRTRLWQGLLWGLAGYLAFNLLPAFGLPPKLPGTPVAPLDERQLWWVGTAIASALGLGLLAFARPLWAKALGVAALAMPHLIGAPIMPNEATDVPAALSQQFIVASLIVAAVFWLLLGSLTAGVYRRLSAAA
jgi:cobalt transporter subunit CbtA